MSATTPGPDLLSDGLPMLETTAATLAETLVDIDDPTASLALPVRTSDPSSGADSSGGPAAVEFALDPAAAEALGDLGLTWDEVTTVIDVPKKVGATASLPLVGDRNVRLLVLVGIGEGRPADIRQAAAAVARTVKTGATLVTTLGSGDDDSTTAAVEGLLLGRYVAPKWGTPKTTFPGPNRFLLVGADDTPAQQAAIACRAQAIARHLAFTPSNIKNPAWLAEQAKTWAKRSGVKVSVRDEGALRKQGFGAILAVGGGSATPPRLVELTWNPKDARPGSPHVVLVGKGITFDSGGLDIKPADPMLGMKTDMSGAAIVLAVLAACRDAGVRCRVTGLLPLAENAVSGTAYRPSDVLTTYGGRTVEVGNTDAEGRLVVADALAYAVATLAPDVLIDVATLTGAATLGLGRTHAPYYVTDDALRGALEAAAAASGELIWEMPLVAEYRPALDSAVADLTSTATSPIGGGSITAALFLREFVGDVAWAHFDIAGAGRSTTDAGILAKGPTAFGVRLLLRYLTHA